MMWQHSTKNHQQHDEWNLGISKVCALNENWDNRQAHTHTHSVVRTQHIKRYNLIERFSACLLKSMYCFYFCNQSFPLIPQSHQICHNIQFFIPFPCGLSVYCGSCASGGCDSDWWWRKLKNRFDSIRLDFTFASSSAFLFVHFLFLFLLLFVCVAARVFYVGNFSYYTVSFTLSTSTIMNSNMRSKVILSLSS